MRQLPKIVKIIYASTSGNVEATCEYIAEILQGHHFEVDMERSEVTDSSDIITNQLFIFATSTWEHGEINPYFNPILEDFAHLKLDYKLAGFIGLGDTRYEPVLFCQGMETARKAYLDNHGSEIIKPLKIDGEPYHQLEEIVLPWVHQFVNNLVNHGDIELI